MTVCLYGPEPRPTVADDLGEPSSLRKRIRVAVVSDMALLRDGIACILRAAAEVEVVVQAPCKQEVVAAMRAAKPQVVVLDITCCADKLLEQIALLRNECRDMHLVVLSYGRDERTVLKVLELGAQGYLCGNEDRCGLIDAVRNVAENGVYLCPGACGALIRNYLRRVHIVREGERVCC